MPKGSDSGISKGAELVTHKAVSSCIRGQSADQYQDFKGGTQKLKSRKRSKPNLGTNPAGQKSSLPTQTAVRRQFLGLAVRHSKGSTSRIYIEKDLFKVFLHVIG